MVSVIVLKYYQNRDKNENRHQDYAAGNNKMGNSVQAAYG